MLDSIISTAASSSITLESLLFCTLASITLGMGVALIHMYRNIYSKNFIITLALLPAIVQIIITMVNGNLGTGVAVMGAFSLVRFRSIPGGAREIGSIFLAMALGLATGMGHVAIAFMFLAIIGALTLLLNSTRFGEQDEEEKELKITIPESLDYEGIFDDLFDKYTKGADLVRVKTTNMGSLYELHYRVILKGSTIEKKFLDELRCRNGNLNIVCGRISSNHSEL